MDARIATAGVGVGGGAGTCAAGGFGTLSRPLSLTLSPINTDDCPGLDYLNRIAAACSLGRAAVAPGPRRRERLPAGGHRLLLAALLRRPGPRLHLAVPRLQRAPPAPHRALPVGQGSAPPQQAAASRAGAACSAAGRGRCGGAAALCSRRRLGCLPGHRAGQGLAALLPSLPLPVERLHRRQPHRFPNRLLRKSVPCLACFTHLIIIIIIIIIIISISISISITIYYYKYRFPCLYSPGMFCSPLLSSVKSRHRGCSDHPGAVPQAPRMHPHLHELRLHEPPDVRDGVREVVHEMLPQDQGLGHGATQGSMTTHSPYYRAACALCVVVLGLLLK